MARNRTAGAIRCPWCPRQFWVERRHGNRAAGRALQAFGAHAAKAHGHKLEHAVATLLAQERAATAAPASRAAERRSWLVRLWRRLRRGGRRG